MIARNILLMCHKHGPLTSRELAKLLRANLPSVQGNCSLMAIDGSLAEVFETGRRGRQYKAVATMIVADRKRLKELVDDYGHEVVLAHMQERNNV